MNLALRGLEANQHQVHELVTLVKDQSEQIEQQSQQIERMMSKDKEQSQQIGRLSEKVEQLMSKDKLTPFEWKIPNFKAVSTRAHNAVQRLVSEPFYLFLRGYKYLLRIEIKKLLFRCAPFVYIKVVPGEFDELLSWPYKEKVRVTLVNQDLLLDDRKNISEVIYFGEKHCSRPLHDDHNEYRLILRLDTWEFPSYIKDDTILIRVNGE